MEGNTLEKFKAKYGTGAHKALLDYTRQMGAPKALPKYLDKFGQNPVAVASKPATPVKRVRGSIDIPLNENGQAQADEVGKAIGPLDHIIASPLTRSKQTAISLAKYTGAPINLTDKLHPWRLGAFEGAPVKNVEDILQNIVLNHPDAKMPGRSPASTENGESFNDFKGRFLPFMAGLMTQFQKDPQGRVAVVTHLRGVRAMQEWMDGGMKGNLDLDRKNMMTASGKDNPSSVHKLSYDGKKWDMEEQPLEKVGPDTSPGILMVRHGETAFNGPSGARETSPS